MDSARSAVSGLGLPVAALVGLAALGVPRVVLHDLDLSGAAVTRVLALVPPIAWLVVVLAARVPRPFVTLVSVGVIYGVMLAATHQLLWNEAYDGDPPRLGDNLADAPDWVHAVVTRGGAVVSSLVVGAALGALVGAIATVVTRRRAVA
jgi:hypothetical protein